MVFERLDGLQSFHEAVRGALLLAHVDSTLVLLCKFVGRQQCTLRNEEQRVCVFVLADHSLAAFELKHLHRLRQLGQIGRGKRVFAFLDQIKAADDASEIFHVVFRPLGRLFLQKCPHLRPLESTESLFVFAE